MSPMHELAKKYASPKRKFAIVENCNMGSFSECCKLLRVVFSTAGSAEAASYAPLILVYPEILQ